MAAQLLELESEHIEVVQSSAACQRGIIGDARARYGARSSQGGLRGSQGRLDRAARGCQEWCQGLFFYFLSRASKASTWCGGADGGLCEVYEAPTNEGNDALAYMLGEKVAM
jgi:hypothetical protein